MRKEPSAGTTIRDFLSTRRTTLCLCTSDRGTEKPKANTAETPRMTWTTLETTMTMKMKKRNVLKKRRLQRKRRSPERQVARKERLSNRRKTNRKMDPRELRNLNRNQSKICLRRKKATRRTGRTLKMRPRSPFAKRINLAPRSNQRSDNYIFICFLSTSSQEFSITVSLQFS
jgi:hypothetical protein